MVEKTSALAALDVALGALEARDALASIISSTRASSAAMADAVEALDELVDILNSQLISHDSTIFDFEEACQKARSALAATARALAQPEPSDQNPDEETPK